MSTTRAGLEFPKPEPASLAQAIRRLSEHDIGQVVRRLTANTTLDPDDDLVLVTTGAAVITVTLPLATEAQRKLFYVKKIDAGGGTVNVATQATDTINGAAAPGPLVLAGVNTVVALLPDAAGLAWWVV